MSKFANKSIIAIMNNKIALALTIGLALASGACKHNHEDHAAHEHEHEHGMNTAPKSHPLPTTTEAR